MLEINHLTIRVEDRILIRDLHLVLNAQDKCAIIGEEGNGKSTLLKAIMNECPYATFEGSIQHKNAKIGYLKQALSEQEESLKVHDFLFVNLEDYVNKCGDFYTLLDSFSLPENVEERKISTLSGGEKVKIQLLKIMLEHPDILLLDEPTNDLDLSMLIWLENFINSCNCPILYVSHDETLLSNTANQILHIEQRKKKSEPVYTWEKIDYDSYVEKRLSYLNKQTQIARSERREHKKKMDKLMRQMQQVDYQLNTISRQDPHGAKLLKKKMKNVKAQERRITSEELTEIPDVEESINLFFEDCYLPDRKMILDLDLKPLKINERILSENVHLEVYGPSHVVIIGKNGCGKTTLMHHIYNLLKERNDIKVAYMNQNYDAHFKKEDTPVSYLCPDMKKEEVSKARQYLGNMKFTRKEMVSNVSDLSGGSKAKLILLSLMMSGSQVLLLDEPTRNVSPLSNPIIRKALAEYKGCIISVSHDRKYIEEVCDVIYELDENMLKRID